MECEGEDVDVDGPVDVAIEMDETLGAAVNDSFNPWRRIGDVERDRSTAATRERRVDVMMGWDGMDGTGWNELRQCC